MRGGKVEIPIELNTKGFDAQIEDAKNKLDTLEQEYEVLKNAKPYAGQKEDLIYYEKEIEKTTNKIIQLRNAQIKQKNEDNKGWATTIKNIKKVGLRMLGLASVYGIVSKASSAYLSQDVELAEKLQSVWVALGSFLAPVIEGIANILLKAVGYINVFVKALTGIDFIANANAKALERQAKAQKNLNNQMYDFDVIRTQQDTSATSGTDTSSSSGMITMPELNQSVIKKLEDLAKWLKENETLVKGVGVALLAVFGASAIANLVSNIGTLLGIGGLGGLLTALMAIATVWVVTIAMEGVKEAYEEVQKVDQAMHNLTTQVDSNTQGIKNWSKAYWEAEEQGKNTEEANKLFTDTLKKESEEIMKNSEKTEKLRRQWNLSKASKKELENQEKEYNKQLMLVNTNYKKLYDQGKLNDEGMKDYALSLERQIELSQHLGVDVSNLRAEYERIDGKRYTQTIELNADDSGVRSKVSSLGNWISNIFGNIFGGGSNKKYAAGGLVTQPTRAIIGEAGYNEYVIPETEDYIGRLANLINQHGGGGTTNVYLDGRLIQRQMNDKQNQYNFSTNR